MKAKIILPGMIFFLTFSVLYMKAQTANDLLRKKIEVTFKGNAQVEVGNAFVGVEMHHSSILPERISFYYPVANSIDLSTDYFHRDTTFIMRLGLKIGSGKKEWLGLHPYEFRLTPYEVTYYNKDKKKSVTVSYKFCKEYPAMVVTYAIKNLTGKSQDFELYTHLETSLHTSHTYALKDKAVTGYNGKLGGIFAYFNDLGTRYSNVFVLNAGEIPASFDTEGDLKSSAAPAGDYWFTHNGNLPEKTYSSENPGIPAAAFLYKKELKPSGVMRVVQIIGQCKESEAEKLAGEIINNYVKSEIEYENYVLDYVRKGEFLTGDEAIDHSYLWAKAMLAVDRHYIDGLIRPMPCPAEYNFYFTHDVLLTDLAAVNFDPGRVKQDLEYTIDHADKNKVIPHAYYWKDSSYTTEYAASDNWNHFWFIIASASYLRHTGDKAFLKRLYPYITKSLKLSLTNMKDGMMQASRPDWWDIGNNYGPRTYMTALEIKSLRDYNYISYVINENEGELAGNELIAEKLDKNLNDVLWSDRYKYSMNFLSGGAVDPHYYIGSLVPAYLGLLKGDRLSQTVETAGKKMVDPKVGIYTVFPMDFLKLDSVWHFADDEEGQPFLYLNGGIWPHGNAWYALALIADGRGEDALKFIKKVMTIKGIMSGPNGQPAMYEVRNGDFRNPSAYGKIDKPEFMWAAAWYINSIYNLFGIRENTWNIRLNPYLNGHQKECSFTLTSWGSRFKVHISGRGRYIKYIKIDGRDYPSAVLPQDVSGIKNIDVEIGAPSAPYLWKTNSILGNAVYSEKEDLLSINLNSLPGHKNNAVIISRKEPAGISINGKDIGKNYSAALSGGIYTISVEWKAENSSDNLRIHF